MRRQGAGRSLLRALGIVGLLAAGAASVAHGAEGPLLCERMLPPDSVVAIVIRDANGTSARWKETALSEVLQAPEMQEMLAPLKQSFSKLFALVPPVVGPAAFSDLFSGEAALAVVVRPKPEASPEVMIQLILRPADAAKGKAALDGLFNWLVMMKAATPEVRPAGTTLYQFGGKDFVILATVNEGVIVLTLNDKVIPEFEKFHSETVARRAGAAGLSADPEYALVRSKIGPAAEAWFYLGLFPWLKQNAAVPPLSMAQPYLQAAGLQDVGGCMLGTTIEDRGFRTRLFVHLNRAAPATPKLIGPEQFALVPRDVVAFGIGDFDFPGVYDKAIGLLEVLPPEVGGAAKMGIAQVEGMLNINLRNDLLAQFSGLVVSYTTEPGSPIGEGENVFLKVRDGKAAAEQFAKFLTGLSRLVQQFLGPEGEAFVRIRTIERPHLTQIYPQSVLPGAFTPNFVVSDTHWLSLGFSARSAVSKMEYFMDHKENVAARADFMRILAKMPKGYTDIAYTDVGRCFGNGLMVAQMATDFIVGAAKIGLKMNPGSNFPIPISELWGMDQGRFPSDAFLREKLFGSVSVTVPQPDGLLFENFSPIGPIPLPAMQAGFQQQVAVTSILAGLMLPALARARGEARLVNCKVNLSLIGKALWAYRVNNNEKYPDSLADLIPQYVMNGKVFTCPSDEAPMLIKNGLECSYRYIGSLPDKEPDAGLFVAYDHAAHDGGRNVLHFDGHVQFYGEEAFKAQLAEQYEKLKSAIAKPDFPGNRDRVKAFFEDKDFEEK